ALVDQRLCARPHTIIWSRNHKKPVISLPGDLRECPNHDVDALLEAQAPQEKHHPPVADHRITSAQRCARRQPVKSIEIDANRDDATAGIAGLRPCESPFLSSGELQSRGPA